MSYGLIGLGSSMKSDAMQGLQKLDGQQQQMKSMNDGMEQQRKAQRSQSMVGMGVSGATAGASIGGPVGGLIGGAVGLLAGAFM